MEQLQAAWELYVPPFIDGATITVQITAVGLLIGFLGGLGLAIARVYGPSWGQRVAAAYVEFWRGTPLLVQLFVIYYGLPSVGLTFDRLPAAFLTLGLNSAAFQAEYLRGALQSVGAGQVLAARAIGMSQLRAVRHVVLPQALRLVLPSWSNEAIGLLKASAVVFLIAVPDLMSQAKVISSRYYNPIEAYTAVSVVYIVLVVATSAALRYIERRTAIPGLGSRVAAL